MSGRHIANKKFLLNRLQDEYGDQFHPIMKMAEACDIMDRQLNMLIELNEEPKTIFAAAKASVDAWEKIAPYVAPKLSAKSVDINGEVNHKVALESPEALEKKKAELEDKLRAHNIDPEQLRLSH